MKPIKYLNLTHDEDYAEDKRVLAYGSWGKHEDSLFWFITTEPLEDVIIYYPYNEEKHLYCFHFLQSKYRKYGELYHYMKTNTDDRLDRFDESNYVWLTGKVLPEFDHDKEIAIFGKDGYIFYTALKP